MMKNMRNKILCMSGVVGLMFAASVNPIYAGTTEEITVGSGIQPVQVSYSEDASFNVTIPKSIVLEKTDTGEQAAYTVKVSGQLSDNQKVSVVPDATFTMSETSGKTSEATISQPKTEFTASEVNVENGTVISGNVTSNLGVGNWTGSFNFNISLQDTTAINALPEHQAASQTPQTETTSANENPKTETPPVMESEPKAMPVTENKSKVSETMPMSELPKTNEPAETHVYIDGAGEFCKSIEEKE